ncbi:MAG: hypothetical protein ACE5IC_07845 [Candidatus Brocadiales bacterium]
MKEGQFGKIHEVARKHPFWQRVVDALNNSGCPKKPIKEVEKVVLDTADSRERLPHSFAIDEYKANIIAMTKDVLLRQFFQNVINGNFYCNPSLIKDRYGSSPEELGLSGNYKHLFVCYWTFKIVLSDLKERNLNKHGKTQVFVLDTILSEIEVLLASAFFPAPGPYALTPEERRLIQEELLRRYAPYIKLDSL